MEHHVPIELCVSGLIHIAHAAFVDLSGDFVDAEPGSGIQGRGAACILPLAGREINAAHAGARRGTVAVADTL